MRPPALVLRATSQRKPGSEKSAGLPPKKPGCYEADVNDCARFMEDVIQRFTQLDAAAAARHDVFAGAPAEYFSAFRRCLLPRSSSSSSSAPHDAMHARVEEFLNGRAREDSATIRAACVTLLQAW